MRIKSILFTSIEAQLITITRNDGHYRIQTRLSSYWACRDQQSNFNNLASQRFEQSYAHNVFIRSQLQVRKSWSSSYFPKNQYKFQIDSALLITFILHKICCWVSAFRRMGRIIGTFWCSMYRRYFSSAILA